MVLAYHVILCAYGFWLPNDPRGSWSTEVWAAHLRPFGPATRVDTHRSLAHQPHNTAARRAAKQALKYPAVRFTGWQARAVGRGFAQVVDPLGFTVHACAILPDHAHLVISRGCGPIEEVAAILKRAATRQLGQEDLHPLALHRTRAGRVPSPWAAAGWYVYLDKPEEVRQRIGYVEANPGKAGLPRQHWKFVVPYEEPRRGRRR